MIKGLITIPLRLRTEIERSLPTIPVFWLVWLVVVRSLKRFYWFRQLKKWYIICFKSWLILMPIIILIFLDWNCIFLRFCANTEYFKCNKFHYKFLWKILWNSFSQDSSIQRFYCHLQRETCFFLTMRFLLSCPLWTPLKKRNTLNIWEVQKQVVKGNKCQLKQACADVAILDTVEHLTADMNWKSWGGVSIT